MRSAVTHHHHKVLILICSSDAFTTSVPDNDVNIMCTYIRTVETLRTVSGSEPELNPWILLMSLWFKSKDCILQFGNSVEVLGFRETHPHCPPIPSVLVIQQVLFWRDPLQTCTDSQTAQFLFPLSFFWTLEFFQLLFWAGLNYSTCLFYFKLKIRNYWGSGMRDRNWHN